MSRIFIFPQTILEQSSSILSILIYTWGLVWELPVLEFSMKLHGCRSTFFLCPQKQIDLEYSLSGKAPHVSVYFYLLAKCCPLCWREVSSTLSGRRQVTKWKKPLQDRIIAVDGKLDADKTVRNSRGGEEYSRRSYSSSSLSSSIVTVLDSSSK